MPLADEISALFRRDLTKLGQQLSSFPEEALWRTAPGIANSAGNLMLHLEGNMREYVGRLLGGVPYRRDRDNEFAATGIPSADLAARIDELKTLVPNVIDQLSAAQLEAPFPGDSFGSNFSTQQLLIHLHGHLNYHLGQIDYLRRVLTGGAAVEYVEL